MSYSTSTHAAAIANLSAMLLNPKDAKSAGSITAAIQYHTNRLLEMTAKEGATSPIKTAPATTKWYEDQLPTENNVEDNKTMNTTTTKIPARWYSTLVVAEKQEEKAVAAANHVYGFDSKTGIQHKAGDTAIYMLFKATNDAITEGKRNQYLTNAQKGFDMLATELKAKLGRTASLKELLMEALMQHVTANPGVEIPRSLLDAESRDFMAFKAKYTSHFSAAPTFAQAVYFIARK